MKINVATHNKHKLEEIAAIWPEAELNAEDTGAEETVEMTVLFNREGEVGGKVRVAVIGEDGSSKTSGSRPLATSVSPQSGVLLR